MSAEPGRVTWRGSNPNGSAVAARSFSFVSCVGSAGERGERHCQPGEVESRIFYEA